MSATYVTKTPITYQQSLSLPQHIRQIYKATYEAYSLARADAGRARRKAGELGRKSGIHIFEASRYQAYIAADEHYQAALREQKSAALRFREAERAALRCISNTRQAA